jgi:integrase
MRLDAITPEAVDTWFDHMNKEGYKNTTVNGYYGTLKTMVKFAAKKKVIPFDPLADFERLLNDRKNLEIISREEFRAIFVNDWRSVWDNDRIRCMANKLAALTGMRCSEVLGLTGEQVFDDHIFLCAQYDEYGYRETKTRVKHHIPVFKAVIQELRELMEINGTGYLFSLDGGVTPISRKHLYNGFIKALKKIGISREEIAERGLNLHAWRHFCNTELQRAGLSIPKVQAVTGHKSTRMTEWYTHFDPAAFGEVPKIQAQLLGEEPEEQAAEGPVSGGHHLTLVRKPETEPASLQERA